MSLLQQVFCLPSCNGENTIYIKTDKLLRSILTYQTEVRLCILIANNPITSQTYMEIVAPCVCLFTQDYAITTSRK